MVIAASQPYHTQADAAQVVASLEGKSMIVTNKHVEIVEELPPPPYVTATLLEDATVRLQCSADQVMRLAQLLFEGVELYGAPTGLITYHRTDSISIAPEARTEARRVISKLYGKHALPAYLHRHESNQQAANGKHRSGNRWWALISCIFKRSRANQQSAVNTPQIHEAIRPTSLHRLPEDLVKALDEQALALYRLIWIRFIASQMKPARYRVTTVALEIE